MKKLLFLIATTCSVFVGSALAQQLVCNPMGVCAAPNTPAAITVCASASGCQYANAQALNPPVILNGYVQNYGQQGTYQERPRPHHHSHPQPPMQHFRQADHMLVNGHFAGYICPHSQPVFLVNGRHSCKI